MYHVDLLLLTMTPTPWWSALCRSLTERGWQVCTLTELISNDPLMRDLPSLYQAWESKETLPPLVTVCLNDDTSNLMPPSTGIVYYMDLEEMSLIQEDIHEWEVILNQLLGVKARRLGDRDPRVSRALTSARDSMALTLQSLGRGALNSHIALSQFCDVINRVMGLGSQLMRAQSTDTTYALYRGMIEEMLLQIDRFLQENTLHTLPNTCWIKLQQHLKEAPLIENDDDDPQLDQSNIRLNPDLHHSGQKPSLELNLDVNIHLLHYHLEAVLVSRHITQSLFSIDDLFDQLQDTNRAINKVTLSHILHLTESCIEPIYQTGQMVGCVKIYRHVSARLCSSRLHGSSTLIEGIHNVLSPLLVRESTRSINDLALGFQEAFFTLFSLVDQVHHHDG